MGIGGNENSTFSNFQSEEKNQPVSGATSASPRTSADSDTLDCHSPPAKQRRVFDFKDLSDPEYDQQQVPQWTGRICQPGWEWGVGRNGNGIKTQQNLGLGKAINHWEWKGSGLKKTSLLIIIIIHEFQRGTILTKTSRPLISNHSPIVR